MADVVNTLSTAIAQTQLRRDIGVPKRRGAGEHRLVIFKARVKPKERTRVIRKPLGR